MVTIKISNIELINKRDLNMYIVASSGLNKYTLSSPTPASSLRDIDYTGESRVITDHLSSARFEQNFHADANAAAPF